MCPWRLAPIKLGLREQHRFAMQAADTPLDLRDIHPGRKEH